MIARWLRSHQISHQRLEKHVGKQEVDGFKAYKYYMAIKLHFTRDSFDVFKNRGAIKGTREAFNARNDRYIFEKLARKYPVDKDLIQFYVANFASGNDAVVYAYEEAEDYLVQWNRRKQSITKILSDDCNKILLDAYKRKIKKESIFNFTLNQYPSILNLYLGKQISLETVRIIDDMSPMVESWKENASMFLLWENEIRRIQKAKGFVKYDTNKVSDVLNNFNQELSDLNG